MAYIIDREPLPSRDIFIGFGDYQAYLSKYGISVDEFANGSTLISAFKQTDEAHHADIEFTYCGGSYFDPPKKSGLLHYFEHLISNRPGFAARKNEAKYNAHTYSGKMTVEVGGPAHDQVLDYGVWPIIDLVLAEVLGQREYSDEELRSEKDVVAMESLEGKSSPKYPVSKFKRQLIYNPKHPFNIDSAGSPQDIKSYSREDVSDCKGRTLTPQGLYVTLITQGREEAHSRLRGKLVDALVKYPNNFTKPQIMPKNLLDEFNPDWQPGQVHVMEGSEKSEILDLRYLWRVPTVSYTPSTFAESTFFNICSSRLFEYFRKAGLGYSSSTGSDTLNNYDIRSFDLSVSGNENPTTKAQKIYFEIKEKVLGNLNGFSEIIDLLHKRQLAGGIPLGFRVGRVERGLMRFGLPIEPEKVNAIFEAVTVHDLEEWKNWYMNTDPVIVATPRR